MRIVVPRETLPGERRVALTPDSVSRLKTAGHEVVVEQSAGAGAGFADAQYVAAGATLASDGVLRGSGVILKVRRPTADEAAQLPEGAVLIGLLQPAAARDLFDLLARRRVTALAMELIPRITRAQSMDALSSQANLSGYAAVLLGASTLRKILPMMTTPAGTIAPARAFVIGAGVAGLQAIATARRLGAIVSAFDVRPVVREQVQSLGATFVAVEVVGGEGQGGYARELAEEQQRSMVQALTRHIKDMDLVVSTAAIPGKPAPKLITEEMVRSMRPGSVIVDVSAETGGNCVLTRPGEMVQCQGVTVLGPLNLPSTLAYNASQMYSHNLQSLLEHLLPREGVFALNLDDEISSAITVTHAGQVRIP